MFFRGTVGRWNGVGVPWREGWAVDPEKNGGDIGEGKNGQNKTRERGTFTGSVCVKGEFFRNC